jgi:DNA replicative helicase MCM subunit Mcm2 (Cdc46/Mcm family)
VRLSTAHAKLRWSWSVEARDVAVARAMMEHVLRRDVGTDPEDEAWVACLGLRRACLGRI